MTMRTRTTTTRGGRRDDDAMVMRREGRRALASALARASYLRARVWEAMETSEARRRAATARTERARAGRDDDDARRRAAIEEATMRLTREKMRHDAEREAVEARERALVAARTTLRDAERAAFEVEVPCALAEAESARGRVMEARSREVARTMRQLRALLPVTIDGDGSQTKARDCFGRGAPRRVRACEWRVPDAADDEGFDAYELAAGLGILMHFTALASRYLDAPRLHRGSHAGSQSFVWAPTSAWDDANASVWENGGSVHVRDFAGVDAERLSLFLPRSVVEGSNDPTSAVVRESRLRLKRAIRLLARSAAATCAHQARECGVVPPPQWGPFAQLCALTASVARGADGGPSYPAAAREASSVPPKRSSSPARVLYNSTNNQDVGIASAHRASPELLESMATTHSATDEECSGVAHRARERKSTLFASIAEASRSRWLWDRSRVSRELRETLMEDDEFESLDDKLFIDVDSTDGIDDWDTIQLAARKTTNARVDAAKLPPRSLVLPPPPSAVDDIDHWERAMLVDTQR